MACVIPVYCEGAGSFKSLESLSKVYTRSLMVRKVMTRKLNLVASYIIIRLVSGPSMQSQDIWGSYQGHGTGQYESN